MATPRYPSAAMYEASPLPNYNSTGLFSYQPYDHGRQMYEDESSQLNQLRIQDIIEQQSREAEIAARASEAFDAGRPMDQVIDELSATMMRQGDTRGGLNYAQEGRYLDQVEDDMRQRQFRNLMSSIGTIDERAIQEAAQTQDSTQSLIDSLGMGRRQMAQPKPPKPNKSQIYYNGDEQRQRILSPEGVIISDTATGIRKGEHDPIKMVSPDKKRIVTVNKLEAAALERDQGYQKLEDLKALKSLQTQQGGGNDFFGSLGLNVPQGGANPQPVPTPEDMAKANQTLSKKQRDYLAKKRAELAARK